MEFIPENDMAFDAASLGFPSIGGCQAICVQTTNGLYGFHDMKSAPRLAMNAQQISAAKLTEFANWILGKLQVGETITAIYGVINRDNQYAPSATGNADWQTVLLGLATALNNFAGPVLGHRLNNTSHLPTGESAYVRFDLNGGAVSVGYKRWSKMRSDTANKVTPAAADHKRVKWNSANSAYEADDLFGTGQVSPVVRIDTSKGERLNTIAASEFTAFQ